MGAPAPALNRQHTRAPDVNLFIVILRPDELRRHPVRGPHQAIAPLAFLSQLYTVAKVGKLDRAPPPEEDVVTLDVPVDPAPGVQEGKGLANLPADVCNDGLTKLCLGQNIAECPIGHRLHHDPQLVLPHVRPQVLDNVVTLGQAHHCNLVLERWYVGLLVQVQFLDRDLAPPILHHPGENQAAGPLADLHQTLKERCWVLDLE
eukprot:CAMPEP_0114118806 /NCGR_PEP_ID=MMETSP0043_2-20121206/5775_1 /TAXON_ID=464988 /ORGANISM="Hemiselmis andersenii, Strain CCMP644" /LENGTH=203 /DNA_ID=CAMNT_0001211313 /DNA_START=148 /DNA_END=757 /DNA_ORIENTATION=+